MKKLLLPLSVILITFCCCPFSPVARYLITDEPETEDLIGTYELSAQMVVNENIGDTSNSHIEIDADGTCDFINFPVFIEDNQFAYKFKEMYTGKCTWNVETIGSVNRNGETKPYWGICFAAQNFGSAVKCADLANDGSPYNLVFTFGDPDSNEIMVFDRLSPK